MRFVNSTKWKTADLRRIAQRVALDELNDNQRQIDQRKHLIVRVVYTRTRYVSGCARLYGYNAIVRVPKTAVDPVAFAWICAHEFAHVRGQKHQQMTGWLNNLTDESRTRYAWASAFAIEAKPTVAKPASDEVAAKKLDHAVAMLGKAQRRRRAAATIETKWKRRVVRLQGRLAMAAGKAF